MTDGTGPHWLLIRRRISDGEYAFYHAHATGPVPLAQLVKVAGSRWRIEETFKTGKDVLGWDQSQVRNWTRPAGTPPCPPSPSPPGRRPQRPVRPDLAAACRRRRRRPRRRGSDADAEVDDADLRIPLGDAPMPAYPGQPRPRRTGLIRLSVAETARLARLAADWAAGQLTPARLAFRLRWPAWRRRHQAAARWYHHAARLAMAAARPPVAGRR